MTGPLIFVSHSRVKPGQLDVYRQHCRAAIEMVESEEPQMIGFSLFESEDGTEVSGVQVHPDADSLDTHLKLFRERLAEGVFDAVETDEISLFGNPSAAALDFLGHIPGIRLRVQPLHYGGFLRPQPL